jgi:RNA polymerase sigma factor (sigma-70 family)
MNYMQIDTKLIHDCIQGNRKAQYQLYQRCYSDLMSVCMRYQRDEQEAAALHNQGFLKILQNLEKYDVNVPFEAWIRRIMINTVIDEFRKNRKVKELIEYRDFSEPEITDCPVDFNQAEKNLSADQLTHMIHQLPPVSRKVFNLYAIDGYKHKEIANLLDMSEGTSKWHLSFARKRLQEMIERSMRTHEVG